MKIATSELEHLREEVKNCHRIIKDLQKKREFVGLTDEEIDYFIVHRLRIATKENLTALIRLCESKIKEKNGA
jgi:hypothetical protein